MLERRFHEVSTTSTTTKTRLQRRKTTLASMPRDCRGREKDIIIIKPIIINYSSTTRSHALLIYLSPQRRDPEPTRTSGSLSLIGVSTVLLSSPAVKQKLFCGAEGRVLLVRLSIPYEIDVRVHAVDPELLHGEKRTEKTEGRE